MTPEPARKSYSLRQRIAWWLLPPLLVLLVINALLSYHNALDAVNRAYDRSLTASLKAIVESIHSVDGKISADIPYAAFDVFEVGVEERIFYAVIGPDGSRLTGYADLAAPGNLPQDGEIRIADAEYKGEEVRLGAMRKRLYDPALPGADAVTVLFAETVGTRHALARDIFIASMRRQVLLIGLGAVLVLIALRSAFRPLLAVRDAVRNRGEEDLTPIPRSDVPSEVTPLIDAINHHMERLSAMLEARRRFLADAAHQLRTPLAVLSTQAEVGQRQSDPEDMRRTFGSLLASIRGARRMTNQMLALSQAEAANGIIQQWAPLDIDALVRDVALELAPLALDRGIDLGFDGAGKPLPFDGNAMMLREMLANLIDNAIRYTPRGGHVSVGVHPLGAHGALLEVVDDGPGIPAAEREQVFKRFYRILGQGDTQGSGLGMAIVREICTAHGGRISLAEGPGGKGLRVTVEFCGRLSGE